MGVFLDEKLKMESQTRLRWNAKILEEFNTVVSIGNKIAETTIDDEQILKLYKCIHRLGQLCPTRPLRVGLGR